MMKKIRVFPFAIFQSILAALVGLIAGVLYSFGGLIIDTLVSFEWFVTSETSGLSYGTILAFGALMGMPIIFASIGFFIGIIEAIIYNLFVKQLSKFINFIQ